MARSRFKEWDAYKYSFRLCESIFKMTLTFPKEEKYSLIDQIRRSSRSVCANLGEAYAKRDYPKHFHAKLTDCIGENYETQVWLEVSLSAGYISQDMFDRYSQACERVGKLLSIMKRSPRNFLSLSGSKRLQD